MFCALRPRVQFFFSLDCQVISVDILAPTEYHPCNPSPCGPNSQCREINGQAVCSCVPEFVGSPPACRPECVTSSECPLNQACVNQRCIDPCPGTCGLSATCQVVNHNPICSCLPGSTGDPFIRCQPIRKNPLLDATLAYLTLLTLQLNRHQRL